MSALKSELGSENEKPCIVRDGRTLYCQCGTGRAALEVHHLRFQVRSDLEAGTTDAHRVFDFALPTRRTSSDTALRIMELSTVRPHHVRSSTP